MCNVYTHIVTYVSLDTFHTHTCIHTHRQCMHTLTHPHTHAHGHTHTQTHAYAHIHVHYTPTHKHTCVRTQHCPMHIVIKLTELYNACNVNTYTISGYYGTSTNRSSLVYTTFSNRILIYHSIELQSMLPSTLLLAMTEEVSHVSIVSISQCSK